MPHAWLAAWHWAVHVTGCDYGLPYGRFGFYNFWSGVAGSFLVSLVAVFFLFYVHHTCHYSRWCLRWGAHELAGGQARVCARHHPDLGGKRPRGAALHQMHRDWLERTRRQP